MTPVMAEAPAPAMVEDRKRRKGRSLYRPIARFGFEGPMAGEFDSPQSGHRDECDNDRYFNDL